jgi:hypothetical protein
MTRKLLALPVIVDFAAQKIERGFRELSASGVAFVVGDVFAHDCPARNLRRASLQPGMDTKDWD